MLSSVDFSIQSKFMYHDVDGNLYLFMIDKTKEIVSAEIIITIDQSKLINPVSQLHALSRKRATIIIR